MIVIYIGLLLLLNLAGVLVVKLTGQNIDCLGIVLVMTIALVVVYAARAVLWLLIGKQYQLSYAYPLLSLNYPFAFIVGLCFFCEPFSFFRLFGTLTITLGVACVASSKERTERRG